MEDNKRSVRLPIYNTETGEMLRGYLEIDTNYFLVIQDRSYCKLVEFAEPVEPVAPVETEQDIVVNHEIDLLDRIISGLPTEPLYDVASLHPREFRLTKERKNDALIAAADTWIRIPEFDNYEINPLGVIRNRWTKRVLEVTEGFGKRFVAMHDSQGFEHAISVEYVMEKINGE